MAIRGDNKRTSQQVRQRTCRAATSTARLSFESLDERNRVPPRRRSPPASLGNHAAQEVGCRPDVGPAVLGESLERHGRHGGPGQDQRRGVSRRATAGSRKTCLLSVLVGLGLGLGIALRRFAASDCRRSTSPPDLASSPRLTAPPHLLTAPPHLASVSLLTSPRLLTLASPRLTAPRLTS